MDRVHCAACNAEHDLSDLEPNFERPDAFFAVAPAERASRICDAGDACIVRDEQGDAHYYLHVLVPIPVRGERVPFHWVAWVEIDAAPWRRLVDGLAADGRSADGAFACTASLANDFPGYPSTLGMRGTVQVMERRLRPAFTIAADVAHPLAREQREGIQAERLLEIVGAHG